MSDLPISKKVRPHQLGWLRRPELDTLSVDVWELPDGRLMAAEKNKEPVLEKMTSWYSGAWGPQP